ncbi:hypothetical protein V8C35DRAFT_278324 [Trichoderma chlorosporum]
MEGGTSRRGGSSSDAGSSTMSAAVASLAASTSMSGSYGIAEFYITCNPPLLPQGVKHIIESAKSACKDKLVEILYEPEIPWFKCITMAEYQSRISDIIQHIMRKLLKREVRPLKFNAVEDVDVHEGTFHPDVASRETNEPLIIPWVVYKSIGTDIYQGFDDYRFPATMVDIPFKSVWRGLENSTGVSIDTLLSVFSRLTKCENTLADVTNFAFHSNCEMTHNLREKIIYIGSWQSMELVDRAVQRLQTILNLLASKPRVAAHFVLLEGSAAIKLTYRWMSHIGLAHATFAARSGNLTIAEEYKYLANAAVIRTQSRDRVDRWITDSTVYPVTDTSQLQTGQTFNAFKGYIVPSKPRNAKVQVLHEWSCVKGQSAQQPAEPWTSEGHRGTVQNSQSMHNSLVPDETLDLVSPVLVDSGQKISQSQDLHHSQKKSVSQQTSMSTWLPPKLHNTDAVAESTQRLTIAEPELLRPLTPSLVKTSIQDGEEVAGSTTQFPFATSDHVQEELLIFLNEPDEDIPCQIEPHDKAAPSLVADLQEVNEDIVRFEQFQRSDDLIWLDDGPKSPQLSLISDSLDLLDDGSDYTSLQSYKPSEYKVQILTTVSESNPLEAQEQDQMGNNTMAGLLDTPVYSATRDHADDLLTFGMMEERPREFFRTMNQKGGRSIVNSSKKTLSPRKTGSDAWSQSDRLDSTTPMESRANATFESDFPALGGEPKSQKQQGKQPLRYADVAKLPNSTTQGPPRGPSLKSTANRPPQVVSTESVASSSKVGGSSKEPRLTKRHEESIDIPMEKSDILRDAENQLKKMSQILELTSGYVSLEVVFGRIYIKKMGPSFVNHTGSGPAFAVKEVIDLFNGENFRQDCIGFSPILSTLEGDANSLVSITPSNEAPWHLFEKETWYDFQCTYFGPRGEEPIIVELNADKLQYRVRGPRHEVFAIYLHCPQRAWDLKARATRSRALEPEYSLNSYVQSLIADMDIRVDDKGDVTIQYPDYNGTREVETIIMRRVARYHHGKKRDSSVLTVTMTYSLEESLSNGKKNVGAVRVFACPNTSMNSALPHKYFEASLTSSRLRRHFDHNVNLEYGDKTGWDTDQLESEGVFDDMLRPAFGMVSDMDHIGASNNTMRGVTDEDAFHESLVEVDVKKKKWAFW